MTMERRDIERLLDNGDSDAAIEELTRGAAPTEGWQFVLLARAYSQRGDSRGDLFSANFFADRAAEAGLSDGLIDEIRARYHRLSEGDSVREQHYKMGGVREHREERPASYPFSCLIQRANS